jgi:hypothetical protein
MSVSHASGLPLEMNPVTRLQSSIAMESDKHWVMFADRSAAASLPVETPQLALVSHWEVATCLHSLTGSVLLWS